MGKKNKKKSDKNSKSATTSTTTNGKEGLIMVDPARVRFQHARIRPFFSGCGRSVVETLEGIRQGKLSPSDLPPIQVLVGPITTTADVADDGPWYFSLNNRRLWVLKRCREEGLLGPNNQIAVRVRKPKSEQEMKRYTIENCALEAKIMPEKSKNATIINNKSNQSSPATNVDSNATTTATAGRDVDAFNREKADDRLETIKKSGEQIGTSQGIDDDDESYSSDEDDDGINTRSANRFSALLL